MSLTAKDFKAIGWYAKEHTLKPDISLPPTIYFKDSKKQEVKVDLSSIMSEYASWNEEDKKQRARERAQLRKQK